MLKILSVHELRIGMYIHRIEGGWIKHPFWRKRFVIKTQAELVKLLASAVTYVEIDTERGVDVANASSHPEERSALAASGDAPHDRVGDQQAADMPSTAATDTAAVSMPREDAFQEAALACARSRAAVTTMFSEARLGSAIDSVIAESVVADIYTSICRHPSALISLARLKTAHDYTYMHSVAVCALMLALARHLGHDETAIRLAGMAGLLHDLGKASIAPEVLNKPDTLTASEWAIMRTHPEAGLQILALSSSVDALVCDACLHHHEKIDGSGYPHGLKGDEIGLLARMVAICDVYDAVTSDRPYKKGWDPAEALHRMASWEGHLDRNLFLAFVKTVGIYPPGSLVRLTSGRLAIVTDQPSKSLIAPNVRVFYCTKALNHVAPYVLDLSRTGCDETIIGREPTERWNRSGLNHLWLTESA